MATFKKGILGGFSGTVGTVVGASWRGLDVMRSRPKSSGGNPTPAQLMQRQKFALAIRFQNSLRTMQKRLYGNNEGVQSRVNLAAKHLLKEVVGERNGTPILMMDRVLVTKGELHGFDGLSVKFTEDETLEFTWNDNSGGLLAKPSDMFSAAVYEEEDGQFLVKEGPETRDSGFASLKLPAKWTGKNVHVYAFFQNSEQVAASTSMYLGSIMLI